MTAPTGSVQTEIALMNQKLDYLIEQTNVRGADHEARLRRLERSMYLMIGAGAAAGGGSGWLFSLLAN